MREFPEGEKKKKRPGADTYISTAKGKIHKTVAFF